jgi:LCP family protein required for cell wall assembly
MRRKHIVHQSDRVEKIGFTGNPRVKRLSGLSVKFKSKKRTLKFVISCIAIVFLAAIGYETYSFFAAANNVLDSNITLGDIKNFVSASKGELKETDGKTNILVLGKGGENHPGGQLTDTIQTITINHSDKKVAMISLPRDLQVKFNDGQVNKLNYAYSYGYNKEKDKNKKSDAGAKSSGDMVSKILGVDIHYYVSIDFVGFKELVDALGGITVNVTKDLYDPYYPKDVFTADGGYKKTDAYTTVSIKSGKQTMNGETALKYARSRETTSDFDRARRQQEILVAVKQKAFSIGVLANPKKVTDIFAVLGSHIKTNLGLTEIKELLELVDNLDQTNIITKVIDNNATDGLLYSTSEGGYYLLPKGGNYSGIQKMVKNIFASSTENIEVESIEVYNASGVTGVAGKVAQLLTDKGLTIDKIETYPENLQETMIVDGAGDIEVINTIKSVVSDYKIEKGSTEGVVKIIIGRDYGN